MKFIVLVFLFLFSSLTYAQAPKHLAFLIHGIGATPSTFGQMQKGLMEEAKVLDPYTDWQVINFSYDTGSSTKDVMIFSKELADFIALKFSESGGIGPDDKFSLIMHSQGGLIGLNFLLQAFKGDKAYHPELQNHLDAFITLGTPYWGAKIAIFANRMMPFFSYLRIPLSDKFGEEELKDMELASDFSAVMRETLIDKNNSEILKKMKAQGRFLIFSGVTERLNLLAPFVTGKNRYEDDTAVPIPSSRLDFFYYIDSAEKHTDFVSALDFKETNLVDPNNYIVVNAFHVSPFPQKVKFPGIAKVPERCAGINYEDCDHPTYRPLIKHLFKQPQDPSFVRDLTSFAIDVKLNVKGIAIDRKNVMISFKALTTGLKIGKDIELYNKVGRWNENGDYRLYHTGYIDSKRTSSTLGRVEMIISGPGLKDRTVIIPVRTTMSTFVELDLEQKTD